MSRPSLRTRILLGAGLWTAGLFIIVSVGVTWVLFTHPHVPAFFHHVFAHTVLMSAIAVVCLALGLTQLRRGLSSVSDLRARLADVHAGRERRVTGEYASEVQPLVGDLNALLETHEANVARAQARAGDLAHGLKTPLAVLTQEADRARDAGHTDLAATIAEEVHRMRRQVDFHLAQARAAASGATPNARTVVAESAAGLKRTLDRLYAARGLTIALDVPETLIARVQREDLDEILGNVLDNACKWARGRVEVRASATGDHLTITVDDDGLGLAEDMRARVLQRGVRADEAAPGTGLGLAIVSDLVSLYGGTVSLSAAPAGGLRVTLTLARA